MAKSVMLLMLLAQFVTSAPLIDVSQIRVYPEHGSVAGVFHAWLSKGYVFSASEARDVCERLGVTIADKSQVEKALALGFETCKFGWINEQVAVVPRIQAKESCGKNQLGLITWRAPVSSAFDVYCFNSTDYEAHLDSPEENPSTAVSPTAHTSRAQSKLAKTTRSASRDDLQSTSTSFPESVDRLLVNDSHVNDSSVNDSSVNDSPESQAFSKTSRTTAVGLIALLTTVFAFLLLAVAAVCYLKKNKVGRWNKSDQRDRSETEICEKTRKESQAEVKNQHKMTSNTDDISITIKTEEENGTSSRPATTDKPSL
ncbi:lymphatic vessel endothelial hyaluronic acid receptor 1a [Tachysurus fulvidraco]|uniref:lymphatic vessel endothelial hyaluronic acid receptor 1a n=1 Tax=Tachysurus fulvidraco TaxID=1234273 RepID=UPI000F4F6A9A|nr:lymphatic vessel endothelial hyaluronic acid receptor 1a [Tachysurus fulvidraco]